MRNSKIDTVVFDVGEVLLKTDIRALYSKWFSDPEEMEYFLEHILMSWRCSNWNYLADIRPVIWKLATYNKKYSREIWAYYYNFLDKVTGPVEGASEMLQTLKDNGYRIFGLTNWSADTFQLVKDEYRFMSLLDDILVSGDVGIKKPDLDFFLMAIERFGLEPKKTLFVDDKPPNVKAAMQVGMEGLVFVSATNVLEELERSAYGSLDDL